MESLKENRKENGMGQNEVEEWLMKTYSWRILRDIMRNRLIEEKAYYIKEKNIVQLLLTVLDCCDEGRYGRIIYYYINDTFIYDWIDYMRKNKEEILNKIIEIGLGPMVMNWKLKECFEDVLK